MDICRVQRDREPNDYTEDSNVDSFLNKDRILKLNLNELTKAFTPIE